MIRRPPRSTLDRSSAASDVYKRQVQTTRHRIKGILTTKEYQIIFSDTPGIIDPKYKLQEKMMGSVKSALEDADVALLLPVSYTHLRAHETVLDLVCRLLLEKKKNTNKKKKNKK